MGAGTEALDRALARHGRRAKHPAARAGEWLLYRTAYQPWEAQVMLHRSTARWRFMVCGRGAGKTYCATQEVLDVILASPPGSTAAVLVPTASLHMRAVREALEALSPPLPGCEWKVSERTFHLPGRRTITVHHAERKEKGELRGPSVVMLWVDEGAVIAESFVNAAIPALRAKGVETRLLVTTTPLGKNWVFHRREEAALPENAGKMENFRFRSTDSPYAADSFTLEQCRKTMSPEFFAQEYLAEFVDSLLLVFEDFNAVVTEKPLVERTKQSRCWLGVDIGRTQDWTVLTLMDEHAQAEVLDRWKSGQGGPTGDAFWRDLDERVLTAAKAHGATVVVDVGGAGGSAGARLAAWLRTEHKVPVLDVRTNVTGTKGQIVEQLQADVSWRKIRVLRRGQHVDQLIYEAGRMQVVQKAVHGQPIKVYEGPQIEGEHDDCVISLALANWGRTRGAGGGPYRGGDLSDFTEGLDLPAPTGDLGDWGPLS